MPLTESERKLRATIAAHESWARTGDRTARTSKAREAFAAKFEQLVDPDGTLPPAERRQRAESARKAHYARLAFRSAQARRAKAEGRGIAGEVVPHASDAA